MSTKVYRLFFRRFAPFKSFGGGFEGDNRSHSTSLKQTSRTSAHVKFNKAGVIGQTGHSSGTEWIVGSGTGKVSVKTTFKHATGGTVVFRTSSAGSNPLVPGAPDIDTFITCAAGFTPAELMVSGQVHGDGFPHAEVFIMDWKDSAHMLMEYSTRSGWAGPFHRLFGSNDKNKLGTFRAKIALNADGSLGKLNDRAPYKFTKDPGAITIDPPRIPSTEEIMDWRNWM